MELLTETSLNCLVSAGWHKGRSIDIDEFVEENKKCGFAFVDLAADFLREYGYLRLKYPHYRVPESMDSCHFNATIAAGSAIPGLIQDYEKALGRPLTVIGEAFTDHMTVVMDDLGRVYGGFEDIFHKFGDTGVGAINCLCGGYETEPIYIEPFQIPPGNNKIQLSDKARETLLNAGWKDSVESASAGSAVEVFLKTYGDISFQMIRGDNSEVTYTFGMMTFPEKYLLDSSKFVGYRLYPVGSIRTSLSTLPLLMDAEGRMYCGMEDTPDLIWFYGASGADAINNIIEGKSFNRV